ncbi:MAG: adenylyltransferase/cytidyltransferase family protein [Phycisphaerales bacterium]|nr:adenylyltransferase/cytidyltransferase family protein [Phycisphaerales bacterium]
MAPSASSQSKVLSLPTLLARCREAREQGRQIVHCHGCFDLVHPGHVRHLEFAARLGDILLVTISGDGMIDKGTGRPLIPERLRAENLAALNCVDWVYIDPHPTALEVINQVKPDVYLKGREYESNRDPRFLAEREAVESHGGRVVFSSGDIVFSSSALIAALTNNHDPIDRALEQLSEVNDLRPSTLEGIVDQFSGKRIVVIGEPIIDRYVHCERPEVASESPVMTLRPLQSQTFDGGAAIICRHIASLGGQAELVTALPHRDDAAVLFVERLRAQGIAVRSIESDQSITEKQRYLVGAQKVMKVDLGRPMTIDERGRSQFVRLALEAATQDGGVDGVIFADFGQGLLTPATLDRLIQQLRPRVRIMAGDVSGKRASLLRLQQMDLVCPTEDELREAMSDFADGLGAVVWRWLERTNVQSALVTMGAEGVIAFSRRSAGQPRLADLPARLKSDHIPGLGPIGIDPLGCGDAMLSTATLALCAGGDLVQAGYLGSLAASIESRQLGNVPVGAAGLRAEWQRLAARHLLIASAV